MKHVDRRIVAVAVGLALAQGAQAEVSMNVGVTSNNVWRGVTHLRATPEAMATAKASMARATAMAMISRKGMSVSCR